MKIIFNWNLITILATFLMFMGFTASLLGIHYDYYNLAVGGLVLILTVCMSWWLWVMYIISTIIKTTEVTIENLEEVKEGIKEVKILIIDYKDINDKYISKG